MEPARIATLLALAVLSLAACGRPAAPAAEQKPAPSAGAVSTEQTVRLSAAALARHEIKVGEAGTRLLEEQIEAPAEVQLAPNRIAHVTPLVAGQLQHVSASIGDQVVAGQTLALLRSVELGQARAELQKATAMLEVAQANFAREERLRAERITSQRSFLEAQLRQKEAQAELDAARARMLVFGQAGGSGPELPLRAPISGTVTERHATQGENVGADHTLFVIADTSKVWAVAHVYEKDMPKVRAGGRSRLALQAQPGTWWEGRVGYVAPVVDEKTRTLEVRVELDNKENALRPGLFGRLQIASDETRDAVVIPEAAVQTVHGDQLVFVPGPEPNTFRAQKVQVGRRSGDLVEIREGLRGGDRVVVAGAFLLKSQALAGELGAAE